MKSCKTVPETSSTWSCSYSPDEWWAFNGRILNLPYLGLVLFEPREAVQMYAAKAQTVWRKEMKNDNSANLLRWLLGVCQ